MTLYDGLYKKDLYKLFLNYIFPHTALRENLDTAIWPMRLQLPAMRRTQRLLDNPGVWTLKDGSSTASGGWAALNPKNGAILWETKDPLGSRAEAAVSVANELVFGCNLEPGTGRMYALNARTCAPLWSFAGSGACNAGPSIIDGMVFWGRGTFGFAPGPRLVYGFGF